MQLKAIYARQILDSRGHPTVEVEAATERYRVRALVPSGASTGVFEAKELRDGGSAWNGKGVSKAVKNVQLIAKAVVGKEFADQAEFDKTLNALDGTSDKSRLGANALLGVSMAYSKLAAAEKGVSLYEHIAHATGNKPRMPVIYANVINGGKHAGTALKMQEFMIVPRAKTFVDAVESITKTYHALHALIAERYGGAATGVGDEGGFAPPLRTPEEALTLLREATKEAKTKMWYAMDAAASEFYDEQTQKYTPIEPIDAANLAGYYEALVGDFGVISLEDPFEQHAFNDFALLRERLAKSKLECQVVGDDLTVTNPARIEQAIDAKSCDCLLLKVNQIGTVTEALEAAAKAKAAGWNVMVSHRSGETDDAYIAHLAVGLGCGQIKIGAPARGERVAKYNELLRIAEHVREYKPA